jgi:hypothetical protein
MLGFVFVAIVIMALGLLVVGGAMVWDMAFGDGKRIVTARDEEARRWRPPYVSGRELYSWARSMTNGIVRELAQQSPNGAMPGELATRLNQGASRAMLPGAPSPDSLRAVACPRHGQGVLGVSAPEAIRIAEYLRRHVSEAEVTRLRDRAKKNAVLLMQTEGRIVGSEPCVLQGDERMCVAYPERPFACRPLHASILARELGLDLTAEGDTSFSIEDHMEVVRLGVEEGLAQGLDAAGLDANRYELHSALALALERPDAATRWSAGEDIFAGCQVRRTGPSERA